MVAGLLGSNLSIRFRIPFGVHRSEQLKIRVNLAYTVNVFTCNAKFGVRFRV